MNSTNSAREILHQTALKAPSSSGVYLWKNPQGTVIYVGKAKNLKNRLSSYFSKGKDIKTRILISRAQSIEYITTANEYEAFLLENNLIKKYTPRYNIDLKDGKSYPVLRVTNEKFPRVFKTRQMVQDGSLYFGPYPDVTALEAFIDTLYKLYPLRHCKQFRERDYPCLYYHIGRCKAPCCKKIDKDSYNAYIGEISELLEGKGKETEEKLEREMKEAAKDLNFEKAARLRDGIKALAIMQSQNIVEDFSAEDRDYIAFWREGELASFTVLKIREGKVQGRDNYRVTSLNEDEELLPEFINAYYGDDADFPPAIYVPTQNGLDFMERWLKENFKDATKIVLVAEGIENYKRHKAALDMASQNAHEDIIRRLRERGDIPALQELKEELRLKNLPVRIEGFDIAHIGGKFPVASLISFYNGNPDKKNYRYFRLKTTNGIIDDFASMREAATRRYTRLLNEGAELPDLILIDGGIGQVNAVEGVLKALDLDIPVAGLAKRDEEIYRPGDPNPISLPKRSDALRLLQRVRDETHRFATSRNQRLRTKENIVSAFAAIPGIGSKREKILTQKFVTIEKLAAANKEQVAQALGVQADKAAEILDSARRLSQERNKKKEEQMQSLKEAGTTKEIAAHNEWIASLADQA
ncbi:MAG: excinuclease ABC subunit UvrC [Treponema sp.]|nr:excinuclease ABC subunit UvrC [Treponema sp.]